MAGAAIQLRDEVGRAIQDGTGVVPSRAAFCRARLRTAAGVGTTAAQSGAAFVQPRAAARLARLRRSVGFAARILGSGRPGFRPDWCCMVTLTYRPGAQWMPDQITRALRGFHMWCKRRAVPCRYVWVAELQKRGAVHYHVAVWLPEGMRPPKFDTAFTKDGRCLWPHGSTNRVVARKAVPYLMKYLSKGSGALQLPSGARGYGVGGLEFAQRRARRWLRLPAFVKARADIFDDWRPATGGGWSSPEGFTVPSEYERAWLGDAYGLIRTADYGRPFEAAGPFSWIHRGQA